MPSIHGDEVHGEVISSNASGGVAVTFYDAGSPTTGNSVAARVVKATEFVVITDVILISTAGGVYDLVADTAAAGRHIVKGNAAALGGIAHHFETPITCPQGVVPTLFAAAGQVDMIVSGYFSQG
jgi:hypothetical protein